MKLICGDAQDELRRLPENSVDSVICDPPYGLKFMGKRWIMIFLMLIYGKSA